MSLESRNLVSTFFDWLFFARFSKFAVILNFLFHLQGTKCIDPNTGLIYFKYDFGYEFGILFPGEGRKFVGGSSQICNGGSKRSNEIYPLKLNDEIEIPVRHESSINTTPTSRIKEVRFEDGSRRRKRYSLPVELNIDFLHDDFNGKHLGSSREGTKLNLVL